MDPLKRFTIREVIAFLEERRLTVDLRMNTALEIAIRDLQNMEKKQKERYRELMFPRRRGK